MLRGGRRLIVGIELLLEREQQLQATLLVAVSTSHVIIIGFRVWALDGTV